MSQISTSLFSWGESLTKYLFPKKNISTEANSVAADLQAPTSIPATAFSPVSRADIVDISSPSNGVDSDDSYFSMARRLAFDTASQYVVTMASFFSSALPEDPYELRPQGRHALATLGLGMAAIFHPRNVIMALAYLPVIAGNNLRAGSGEHINHVYRIHNLDDFDGTSNFFKIARIDDSSSTIAHALLSGAHNDYSWAININLMAGTDALQVCWNGADPQYIPQGLRIAETALGERYLEVQGTNATGAQLLTSSSIHGLSFFPIEFKHSADTQIIKSYDFAGLGSLSGGCFFDLGVANAQYTWMNGNSAVLTVDQDQVVVQGKLEVSGLGRFTGSSGFSIGSDPGQNRLEYSSSGFNRISALSSGDAYLGLSAKSLSIGTTYGSISPPGNGAIFEGNVGIGTATPTAILHIAATAPKVKIQSSTNGDGTVEFYNGANVTGQLVANNNGGNRYIGLSRGGTLFEDTYINLNTNGVILGTAGTERMRVANEGKVGIGTSSPDALLSVNGVASFGAGTSSLPSIVAFGDLDTGMWFPGANMIAWSTGGSERARITTSLFQISTTLRLSSISSGTGTALVVDSNGDVFKSSSSTLSVSDGSASTPAITGTTANTGIWFPSAGHMAFSSSGQERARFAGLGNLLIGHTSDINFLSGAQAKLQITGDQLGSSAGSFSLFSTTAADFPGVYLAHANSNTKGTYTLVTSGFKLGILGFAGADGTQFVRAAAIFAEVDGNPGANDMPGRLVFCTTADGASTCTEHMRITNAGNVGIGTTSPSTKLHIEGSNTNLDGVNTLLGLQGNEAYGTQTPIGISFIGDYNGSGGIAVFAGIAGVKENPTVSNYAGALLFYTHTQGTPTVVSEKMRLTSDGKLGIGVINPGAALEIGGTGTLRIAGAIGGTGTPVIIDANGDLRPATQAQFMAGTAALPSITTSGDLDTGMWFPGADMIAWSTGGSERFRVDSSGNVGIGITSPSTKLHVVGTSKFTGMMSVADGMGELFGSGSYFKVSANSNSANGLELSTSISTPIVFSTNGGEKMRLASDGKVGIGTTNPASLLSVNGVASFGAGTAALPSITTTGDLDTGISFPAADTVAVSTGGSERTRVDSLGLQVYGKIVSGLLGESDGEIILKRSTDSQSVAHFKIDIANSVAILSTAYSFLTFHTEGVETVRIDPEGNIKIAGTGTIRIAGATGGTGTPAIIDANGDLRPQTSSRKFKHDIRDLEFDTKKLSQLRPVRYRLNSDNSTDFGFIAEDLHTIYPLAVNLDKKGNPYSVKYGQICVLLSAGWQEHELKIKYYEKTIAKMHSTIRLLRQENQNIKNQQEFLEARLAKLESLFLR